MKAHQHSSGATATGDQAIGPSRDGNTSKIHMVVDGFGLPIHFEINGSQLHDSSAADDVLEDCDIFDYVIADKGYDKEPLRQKIRDKGSIPMIPRRCNSTIGNSYIEIGFSWGWVCEKYTASID